MAHRSKIHLVLAIIWAILGIPTIFYWHSSILWVALISVYANFVGHWSSWEAAKAGDDAVKEVKKSEEASE